MPAINVECPLLESLQKKWKATGCAPASINKRMGVLHRAFRLACKAGRITSMPPFPERLSEESAIRKGFIEPEDFARFLDALPDDGLRDFVAYLGATGSRRGEARKLRWQHLSSDGSTRHVPAGITKMGIARDIPIEEVEDLAPIIARRRAARKQHPESEFIFFRVINEKALPVRDFRGPWDDAVKRPASGRHRMTCAGPPSATWCAPRSRRRWRWRSPVGRRGASSTATTS